MPKQSQINKDDEAIIWIHVMEEGGRESETV